jgi:hypothetical protein
MNTQTQDERIDELIFILKLKKINGFYKTLWGNKTDKGLRETIKVILGFKEPEVLE